MIDVISKTCNNEWCDTHSTNKYEGYCVFCYVNMFPDKPLSRNYKTKEISVRDFVISEFPEFDWISDKTIKEGCSKRRPDIYLDLGYQVIIIEIDENQHIDYENSCEVKRTLQLSQDIGHRPLLFIRFNPDKYVKNGENITSCWAPDKNGIVKIKKSKQKEWKERLNTLKKTIQFHIDEDNQTEKTIEVERLFYDE